MFLYGEYIRCCGKSLICKFCFGKCIDKCFFVKWIVVDRNKISMFLIVK